MYLRSCEDTPSILFPDQLIMTDAELADEVLAKMREGDEQALASVFSHYRERLRRIVRFRLDYRMAGRVSDSDVLQDTFIAAARRLDHFTQREEMPAFLWLRLLINQ